MLKSGVNAKYKQNVTFTGFLPRNRQFVAFRIAVSSQNIGSWLYLRSNEAPHRID
jgi:hypothetical protein